MNTQAQDGSAGFEAIAGAMEVFEALDQGILSKDQALDDLRLYCIAAHEAKRPPSTSAEAVPMEWVKAVQEAYGWLWNINNEPLAPIPMLPEGKAAYQARKPLRDLLTTEQRGEAINAVRATLENMGALCGCRAGECESKPSGCRMAREVAPSTTVAAGEAPTCQWCVGTGRFSDHACRFCRGSGKAPPTDPKADLLRRMAEALGTARDRLMECDRDGDYPVISSIDALLKEARQ